MYIHTHTRTYMHTCIHNNQTSILVSPKTCVGDDGGDDRYGGDGVMSYWPWWFWMVMMMVAMMVMVVMVFWR